MSAFRMEMKPIHDDWYGQEHKNWKVNIFRGDQVVHKGRINGKNYQGARAIAERILRDHSTVVYADGGGRPSGRPPRVSRRGQYFLDLSVVQEEIWTILGFSQGDLAKAAVQAMYRRRGWEIPDD